MKLIVYTLPFKPPDFGNLSQDKYSANKTVSETGSFTVKNVEPGDSGVYLCAVWSHCDADTCHAALKLHIEDYLTTMRTCAPEGFHYFSSEKLGGISY